MAAKKCLIVGTDKLGAAPRILKEKLGVIEYEHWDGRQKKLPRKLPAGTDIILVYCGFISHEFLGWVKKLAKKNNVQTIFVNRGLAELDAKLEMVKAA